MNEFNAGQREGPESISQALIHSHHLHILVRISGAEQLERLLVGGGAGDREEGKSFLVEAIFCPFPKASLTRELPYQLWGQETEVWCPINHRADLQPGARWRPEGGLEEMKGKDLGTAPNERDLYL